MIVATFDWIQTIYNLKVIMRFKKSLIIDLYCSRDKNARKDRLE